MVSTRDGTRQSLSVINQLRSWFDKLTTNGLPFDKLRANERSKTKRPSGIVLVLDGYDAAALGGAKHPVYDALNVQALIARYGEGRASLDRF